MRVIYGFDPLCGWCFGFVPAMRALRRAHPDLPVTLAMPGLVTGPRVGPYAEMEGYIRSASGRLRPVTGRAPSEAFFDLIRRPGVIGDSRPPIAAIAAVAQAHPDAALDFAHAVTEAHFVDGADLNDPGTFTRLLRDLGLGPVDIAIDDVAIARVLEEGRAHGIASFPTLMIEQAGRRDVMPSLYDPDAVLAFVAGVLRRV